MPFKRLNKHELEDTESMGGENSKDPPPMYSSSAEFVQKDAKEIPQSGESTAPMAGYPAQPQHAPVACRTFHIYSDNLLQTRIRITDSDKTSILYKVDVRLTKPHLKITSAANDTIIGTVAFHILSCAVDCSVRGQEMRLTKPSVLKSAYAYDSPALQNTTLTWRSEHRSYHLDLVCLDENKMPLVRLLFSDWSVKKVARMEILDPRASTEVAIEELVVTALAMVTVRQLFLATPAAPVVAV